MDYNKLAELLFPHITKTPEDYEKKYNLPTADVRQNPDKLLDAILKHTKG